MKTSRWIPWAVAAAAGLAVSAQALSPADGGAEGDNAAAAPIRKLFVEGRWREAVEALARAQKDAPADEDLLFMRAMVAMETGEYNESIRLYSRLLEKYPDNAGLKNNVAWLRLKSDDPALHNLDQALREAQEAVMAASQDYNIWNTLGEIYLARGNAMKAMRFAVLARDMAALAGESDLRVYQDLVSRCETQPAPGR